MTAPGAQVRPHAPETDPARLLHGDPPRGRARPTQDVGYTRSAAATIMRLHSMNTVTQNAAPPGASEQIAAVDLGSNSFHMVIAQMHAELAKHQK